MTARILDGKAIAAELRRETAREVAAFTASTGVKPCLVVVLVGDNPASAVYVKNKHAACEKSGIESRIERYPANITQRELLDCLARLNADRGVHGILVQLPLPTCISSQAVLDSVAVEKDVDCFHPHNVGLLSQGRPRFAPCTPSGVQHLLKRTGIETAGRHAVILGRSDIVGKPLASLLIQKGTGGDATVTVCHSRTHDLRSVTRTADILVAAIGVPEFVTAEMIRPGAVVIDVGINRVGDRLVGDVAFEPACQVASAITPVPGGIGPLTIAVLLRNTLTAARLQTTSS
jgi:methylenetetrahydrofolate dehydrogenase (NADP+)/methenyltetrahydrofolate cyclohydrolase